MNKQATRSKDENDLSKAWNQIVVEGELLASRETVWSRLRNFVRYYSTSLRRGRTSKTKFERIADFQLKFLGFVVILAFLGLIGATISDALEKGRIKWEYGYSFFVLGLCVYILRRLK